MKEESESIVIEDQPVQALEQSVENLNKANEAVKNIKMKIDSEPASTYKEYDLQAYKGSLWKQRDFVNNALADIKANAEANGIEIELPSEISKVKEYNAMLKGIDKFNQDVQAYNNFVKQNDEKIRNYIGDLKARNATNKNMAKFKLPPPEDDPLINRLLLEIENSKVSGNEEETKKLVKEANEAIESFVARQYNKLFARTDKKMFKKLDKTHKKFIAKAVRDNKILNMKLNEMRNKYPNVYYKQSTWKKFSDD